MMRKYLRHFRTVDINVLIYNKTRSACVDLPHSDFIINSVPGPKGRTKYFIVDNGVEIHQSFLFPKVHVLSLIKKSGPVIGDCVTSVSHRGKSIYPIVIKNIADELLEMGTPEVFIIVNSNNESSIRGIEKAGFNKLAKIEAKRFLIFYYKKVVNYFK